MSTCCASVHCDALQHPCRDIAAVKGSQPFFKKCMEKVQTTKKCPLCTRGFADQSGVDGLVKSVSGC